MYDLIIIGGGMSGISVAYQFRDRNILLLEKGDLLAGATGNNAGFLITGFAEHFERTAQRWGITRAHEIQEIHEASHRKIRALTNLVEEGGSYSIAFSQKEAQDLRASYESMLGEGFPVEWLEAPPVGLRTSLPAIRNPADALLDSQTFWRTLATNIPLKTKCMVVKVEESENELIVITSKEEFHTKNIVYCLNAFSGKLLPEIQRKFIPLRGQMVELPLRKEPPCRNPVLCNYGEIYWCFTDKTLRFGGLEYLVPEDEVGIATSLSQKILQSQLQWIEENFEDGLVSPLAMKAWYSTMAYTVDGFPFVGRLPGRPNQYILAGMCGIGHSYVMECASWLRDLILRDVNVIPAYFSSDRMLNLPDYTGGDWRSLYEAWNH